MRKAGVKQEMIIFKINSELPKTFSLVSLNKQSYEKNISELEPRVLIGERACIKNVG